MKYIVGPMGFRRKRATFDLKDDAVIVDGIKHETIAGDVWFFPVTPFDYDLVVGKLKSVKKGEIR